MAEMFESKPPAKRGITGLAIGALIGLLLIGGGVYWWLNRTPSIQDQTAQILAGAYRPGSAEFDDLQKKIMIAKDENRTVESPTGLGTISMFIYGTIYNRTGKTITALEVNVNVTDQQKNVIKDKNVLVVPMQQPSIEPGDSVPITTTLDGFDRKADRANYNFKVTAIKVEG
ncbi:MAG TPA: FxLYD domain-containing protein [Pyrinomonadaceae bacterium]|jgi:hypothetical protein